MKQSVILLFLASLLLYTSCEKEIANDEPKEPENPTQPTVIDEGQANGLLTVAQAIAATEGSFICVKGYVVASTQRSMNNIDFKAPFSGSSAIVLADQKVEEGTELDTEKLMPVCLTDCSQSIRGLLNLVDNPQNHNHLICIYGVRRTYMGRPGLKEVMDYDIE